MPSATAAVGTTAVLTLLAGMGAVAAETPEAAEDLGRHVDLAVDDALHDVTRNWIEPVAVAGQATDGEVTRLRVLASTSELGGAVDLSALTVLDPASAKRLPVDGLEAVRDEDGSLDGAVLTPEDLARVTIPLDRPIPAEGERRLTLAHPEGPARALVVEAPLALEDGWNRLEHR